MPNTLIAIAALSLATKVLLFSGMSKKKKSKGKSEDVSMGSDLSAINMGAEIIAEFEGFRSDPYIDSAGVATVGYGTTVYPDGSPVTMQDPGVSHEEALSFMALFIEEKIIPNVSKIPIWTSMNDGQKAALISFAYNLGPGFFGRSGFETITKALNSPSWEEDTPEAMLIYNRAGGQFMRGLMRRREFEAEVWRSGGLPGVS